MVKMSVKGIHRVRKHLKGSGWVEYHYAWRGGPRLKGVPGSDEYLASYVEAKRSAQRAADPDTLAGIVADYQASAAFIETAESTKRDYRAMMSLIVGHFGTMTLDVLDDREVRREFKTFRDSMIATPRKADRFWQVLKMVLNHAVDNGQLRWNPAAGGGKLYHGSRAEIIWGPGDIALALAKLSAPVAGPFLCALDTGQRQGDVLALRWNQYDGSHIRLTQGKTGRFVEVRASERLKALLSQIRRDSTHVFVNSRGRPWTSDGYQGQFRKELARIGISGLHFHDLRGTFITMRRREGSSIEDIAQISGHSTKDVRAVLEKHYLAKDGTVTDAVILRMDQNK